ncbi:Fe(3+) ABC transporter substrate-binding protein [Psychroflexus sediminis]|uniref:Iron(III) transport system substrate-binding protein n=1 Tax=Psychroflexus sediminis TaxID=470826 RepID=A0A1G7YAH8_9FLAO|nr:Fe(3+) ABC transporter substrate-binding protein [Psychroflexus sediminis]SDG93395.1 iron(III) transport system substrate-binding protein [Psychroflexus sediminis]
MQKILYLLFISVIVFGCKSDNKKETENELTVYTHRHYESDQKLFKRFEQESGIKLNIVNASADELIQKMNLEGEQSPADVLITVDAGRLYRAKSQGLLQSFSSKLIDSIVPEHLKDEDGQWVGLTKRARVIAYAKDRVDSTQLSTYANLASEKWDNEILVRSSSNIYNQSLLASIIANQSKEFAEEWAQGIVENMARAPKGNDRDQVKAVANDEGNLAIVNTYYIGKLLNSEDQSEVEAGKSVNIFFPNQETTGTHINVSGIGVAKYSPNKEAAIQFIEFLLQEEAQKIFAGSNFEYPVNPNVEPAEILKSWGDFKEDNLSLNKLGEYNKEAVIIFDKAGWK